MYNFEGAIKRGEKEEKDRGRSWQHTRDMECFLLCPQKEKMRYENLE
jgi:hypothetical protein